MDIAWMDFQTDNEYDEDCPCTRHNSHNQFGDMSSNCRTWQQTKIENRQWAKTVSVRTSILESKNTINSHLQMACISIMGIKTAKSLILLVFQLEHGPDGAYWTDDLLSKRLASGLPTHIGLRSRWQLPSMLVYSNPLHTAQLPCSSTVLVLTKVRL